MDLRKKKFSVRKWKRLREILGTLLIWRLWPLWWSDWAENLWFCSGSIGLSFEEGQSDRKRKKTGFFLFFFSVYKKGIHATPFPVTKEATSFVLVDQLLQVGRKKRAQLVKVGLRFQKRLDSICYSCTHIAADMCNLDHRMNARDRWTPWQYKVSLRENHCVLQVSLNKHI